MTNTSFKPVATKIYKTGQTRGADDDVIFQNRVGRNSTVLIPYRDFESYYQLIQKGLIFEKGYIVLIRPEDYFNLSVENELKMLGLRLGSNLLVFYETREQWKKYPILKSWKVPTSRTAPLKGQYVARVPATTAEGEGKIIAGFNQTKLKGAGIRVYEYADTKTIQLCKLQLEYLFWSCYDIEEFLNSADTDGSLRKRKEEIIQKAIRCKVANKEDLQKARIIDSEGFTICPLCLQRISATNFATKIAQAEGREVPDLTVTDVSLFHINELRAGQFNHRLYNLGWGHHHCNVTIADRGVVNTLEWMLKIVRDNGMI